MANDRPDLPEDFLVVPSPVDPADVLSMARAITRALKPSEIRERKKSGESESAFAFRLALSAQAVETSLFRKRADANFGRIAAWLGIVRGKAGEEALTSQSVYHRRFGIDDVHSIARLSVNVADLRSLQGLLNERYQVILVYERSFASMKLDGCTFRLASGHPVVALSLRYARYDHFWFTLLHELAHIAMHYDKLDEPILDDLDVEAGSLIETEANRLAADSLIPPAHARRLFRQGSTPSHEQLVALANELSTHPSIIAGAYEHNMKSYGRYAELVNSIDVRTILGIEG